MANPILDYEELKLKYAEKCAEIERLREALSRVDLRCSTLSHRRGEFHKYDEPCPVEAMIGAALAAGRSE